MSLKWFLLKSNQNLAINIMFNTSKADVFCVVYI